MARTYNSDPRTDLVSPRDQNSRGNASDPARHSESTTPWQPLRRASNADRPESTAIRIGADDFD